MKWRTDQKVRAMRKLCGPNLTSSAKLKNLLGFWSAVLTTLSCWLPPDPTAQSSAQILGFQLGGLNSHVTLAAGAKFPNAAASVTNTTPRNSSDPSLSAGQVRFPKQALKGTRDWEHTEAHHPQSPSIIILHTNRAFRWTKSQSIGSTRGVWSVSGEGRRTSQANRGKAIVSKESAPSALLHQFSRRSYSCSINERPVTFLALQIKWSL